MTVTPSSLYLVLDNRYLLKNKINTNINIDMQELQNISEAINKKHNKNCVFDPKNTFVIMENRGENSYKNMLRLNEFNILDGDFSHYSEKYFYYSEMKEINRKFFDYSSASISLSQILLAQQNFDAHLAVVSDSPYLFPFICRFVELYGPDNLTILNFEKDSSALYGDYLEKIGDKILFLDGMGIALRKEDE